MKYRKLMKRVMLKALSFTILTAVLSTSLMAKVPNTPAQTKKKPNILVIWGDDVGWWNISANNHGMMGKSTRLNSSHSAKSRMPSSA